MSLVRVFFRTACVLAVCLLLVPLSAEAAKDKKGKKGKKGTSSVTIVNQSDWEIHYIYLSPSDQVSWGPDQLSDDEVVEEGDSFLLKGIPCNTYDVKLIDEDDDVCVVEDVRLCGDTDRWVITSAQLLECQGGSGAGSASNVTLVNNSAWEIYELYVSDSDDWDWGEDQLDDETIDTGESFMLTGIPCGEYDVKLVDEDDDECIVEDVEICGGSDRWVIDSADLLVCQW